MSKPNRNAFPDEVIVGGEPVYKAECQHGKVSYYAESPLPGNGSLLREAIPPQCDACDNGTDEWYRGWAEARLHTKFPNVATRTAYTERVKFHSLPNKAKFELSRKGFPELDTAE